jgi:hypothetical protein
MSYEVIDKLIKERKALRLAALAVVNDEFSSLRETICSTKWCLKQIKHGRTELKRRLNMREDLMFLSLLPTTALSVNPRLSCIFATNKARCLTDTGVDLFSNYVEMRYAVRCSATTLALSSEQQKIVDLWFRETEYDSLNLEIGEIEIP